MKVSLSALINAAAALKMADGAAQKGRELTAKEKTDLFMAWAELNACLIVIGKSIDVEVNE